MQVNGYVACYDSTGNATCRDAVLTFIDILTKNHSWTTGGSNEDEHWGLPLRLGDALVEVRKLWQFR
jgi:hypothetical protein